MNNLVFLKVEMYVDIKKSRIRGTPTLSTDADSRTDTNLKRLRDLSNFFLSFFSPFFFTPPHPLSQALHLLATLVLC